MMELQEKHQFSEFLAEALCEFFIVTRKLPRLLLHFHFSHGGDSHCSGVKPPKTFPPVSKMCVSVFACPSHRP
jgi:hypothetical protein